ncbi:MAG: glucose-6-phosphate isomerase, partial [Clostridia bacterium]|nr:glucose-6-phosphate isomerase [Clostridia bacterium]
MALKLNTDFIGSSVDLSENGEVAKIAHIAEAAHKKVLDRSGAGSDFLGWVDLPVNYDREEFDRIKKTSEKIRSMCDVFVVIGI